MSLELLFLPPVGGLIGWLTNRLAIRLLFYPHNPWRVPLLKWQLQGILPKRRAQLARTIGEALERELLSAGDLVQYLAKPGLREELVSNLVAVAAERLDRRVPVFLPQQLRELLSGYFQDFLRQEAEAVYDQLLSGVKERLEVELSVGELVEQRLLAIDLVELEALVVRVAGRELMFIEVLGGILGFFIGILQAGLVLVART